MSERKRRCTSGLGDLKGVMKDVSFVSRESMYGVNLSIIASKPAVGALGDTAM